MRYYISNSLKLLCILEVSLEKFLNRILARSDISALIKLDSWRIVSKPFILFPTRLEFEIVCSGFKADMLLWVWIFNGLRSMSFETTPIKKSRQSSRIMRCVFYWQPLVILLNQFSLLFYGIYCCLNQVSSVLSLNSFCIHFF